MADQNEIHNSLLFYSFLKKIVAADSKLSNREHRDILSSLQSCSNVESLIQLLTDKINLATKRVKYLDLIYAFKSFSFVVDSFKSAMHFIQLKEYILKEVNGEKDILDSVMLSKMTAVTLDPSYKLTCAYDALSALSPYKDRVFAIWTLNNKFDEYLKEKSISRDYINYFQILLDESIRQRGISNSGSDYEDRISDLFKYHNLNFTRNCHEDEDESQEHDLVINYNCYKIGVGAKRTLRERYKQYNPNEVDFSLVFTIGEDLTESKAVTITNNYKSDIFVADEIYNNCNYMQTNFKIHKVTSFSLNLLNEIVTNGGSVEH